MSFASAFEDAAQSWLEATGVVAIYRPAETGASVRLHVTIERDVTTVDDIGSTTRGEVASVRSALVPVPKRGDRIEIESDGSRYKVDEHLDDSGHITRLLVSRTA